MTKRPISKSRTAVRAIVFVLIAALGIGLISPMLVANNDWDKRHVHGFFLEPEDSLDVVLIGASQLYILVSTLLQPVSDKVVAALHIERKSAWYQVFSMLRTFVVVLIGYYFDIADGFRAAMGMMLKSVTDLHLSQLRPGAVLEALPLTRYDWCVLLFGTVVIFTASVIQERSQRTIREILDEKCLALRWAVLLAGIFAVVLMGVYGPGVQASEFVYMQF